MTDENRKLALAVALKLDAEKIEKTALNTFAYESQEFLVLTDEEANLEWDAALDSYVDDCVLPGIPEPYRFYFNSEDWKSDARLDGRAHALASYDGDEKSEVIDGLEYFIYRIN